MPIERMTIVDPPPPLIGIGYWCWLPGYEGEENGLPDPRILVRPGWKKSELGLIVSYLKMGQTFRHPRGVSYCRFDCGIDREFMGSRDLTDGVWVWPEGLPHYLEQHAVYLPEEFVDAMRENAWRVPAGAVERHIFRKIHQDYWVGWANKQVN